SWQYQTQSSAAQDKVQLVPGPPPSFVSGADGLAEFQAVLALDPSQSAGANVSILYLGVSDADGAAGQLPTGITPAQVQALGGEIVLGSADNRLTVPGSATGPAVAS